MRHSDHWSPARVRRIRALSPTVREIELAPDAGALPWSPGSHLPLRVRLAGSSAGGGVDERIDTRHYSLVSLGDAAEPAAYRVAVKQVVASRGGSRFMHALREGDELETLPPHNHFELPAGTRPTLLAAGGIGITPLVGMALALAARGADLRMAYAVRQAADLVYAEQLREALGARLSTFAADRGQRLDLDAAFAALPDGAQALVCGPLSMMLASQAAWAGAGRPAGDHRIETFGAGGTQPAQAFHVKLPRHGLEFDVPADGSLLDALEAHGIDVLSDCRRGECGLCAVDVLAVTAGEIDHRDVFLSPRERAAGQRICACVSRLCGPGATVVLDSAWRPDGG